MYRDLRNLVSHLQCLTAEVLAVFVVREPGLREFENSSGVVEPLGVRTVKHRQISIYDRLKVEPSTGTPCTQRHSGTILV